MIYSDDKKKKYLRFVGASISWLVEGGESAETVTLVVGLGGVGVMGASVWGMVWGFGVQSGNEEADETLYVFKRSFERGIDGFETVFGVTKKDEQVLRMIFGMRSEEEDRVQWDFGLRPSKTK